MSAARRRLPSLNALRAFEAAGRHESISLAAAELRVTPGAVSRHIKALELDVGQPLFTRFSQGIRLTEGGRRYLKSISSVFDQIGQATATLRRAPQASRLTISAYSTFSSEWLVPRLQRFREAHPDVAVGLIAAHNPPLPERGAADVGMRLGQGVWPGLHADLLFEEVYVPVCSPRLGGSRLPLSEPADAAHHTLLYSVQQIPFWEAWFGAVGMEPLDFSRGLQFENAALAYSAARNGEGIALGKRYMLIEDLAAGRLVVPFGPMISTGRSHYLVGLGNRLAEPAIAAFRDWVLAEAATTRSASAPVLPDGTVVSLAS